MKIDIATKIRKHYNSEDGDWIIQAGKMKEAKLLKEACETIEKQENKTIVDENDNTVNVVAYPYAEYAANYS